MNQKPLIYPKRQYQTKPIVHSVKNILPKEKRRLKIKFQDTYSVSHGSLRHWQNSHSDSVTNKRNLFREKEIEPLKESFLEKINTMAIHSDYLTLLQKTVYKTYKTIKDGIQNSNFYQKILSNPKIIALGSISVNIYDRAKQLGLIAFLVKRFGKSEADQHIRTTGSGIKTLWVMERAEFDHLTLNIVLVDDRTRLPIDRPIIVTGNFCSPKIQPDITNGFQYTGDQSKFDWLYKAIHPKLKSRNFSGTQHEIWGCKLPKTLVLDNTSEFIEGGLLQTLEKLKKMEIKGIFSPEGGI